MTPASVLNTLIAERVKIRRLAGRRPTIPPPAAVLQSTVGPRPSGQKAVVAARGSSLPAPPGYQGGGGFPVRAAATATATSQTYVSSMGGPSVPESMATGGINVTIGNVNLLSGYFGGAGGGAYADAYAAASGANAQLLSGF